jgi:transcriptional regulator with XRE-family HTH domain
MFGKLLKKHRERKYPSGQQFAFALGVEPHTYRKWERGGSAPDYEVLTRICELLEITPNDLLPLAANKERPFRRLSRAS